MFFRNLLIQLTLITLLSAFVSFAFLIPTLNSLWRDHSGQIEEVEIYRSAGAVYLLKTHLNALEQDKKAEVLQALQSQFNYSVTLESKNQLPLSPEQHKKLLQGDTIFDVDRSQIYHQLDAAGNILAVGDIDNTDPIHQTPQHDEITAVLNLIFRDLLERPKADWADRIVQIDRYFAVTIKMMTLSDNRISKTQRVALLKQEYVFDYLDPLNESKFPEYIFQKVPNSNRVIAIGPVNSLIQETVGSPVLIRFVIIIGVLIFLPLILWLHPSWRTSASLLKATKKFGNGVLSSRSVLFRGSNLNGLAATFNKMAAKIETLYDNNIMLNNAVSHELRTPLTRIEFSIELLRNPLSKNREKQIHRIETAISEIRVMSDEMALYARFDQERPDFKMVSTELTSWLTRTSDDWIDLNAGITTNIVHLSGEIHASIEVYYFRRMIDNLVRNAYKYALTTINVHTEIRNEECCIMVENDGVSIDDKYKEKVFDPFFRLDHSRSRNSGGTGLGLAIVKQIIIWHHGRVWIEDSHSGGVCVKITLPITRPINGLNGSINEPAKYFNY